MHISRHEGSARNSGGRTRAGLNRLLFMKKRGDITRGAAGA